MFKTPLLLLAGLLLAASASAQVKVTLLLDQKQYLLKEPLQVGVRIVNHSGQTLTLTGTNWLSLTVEDREKFVVKRHDEVPSPQEVTVETTFMATQWIDIGRTFDFRENSMYTLRARVRIDQWGEDIYSEPIGFEIIKGTKLWEQQIGVPTMPGSPPEIRKYILQQANYLKELQLYARVTDQSEGRIYQVKRLAPMLLISQPEAQIDTLNQLHVLTQIGMRQFMHLVLNHDGELVLRNTYEVGKARPLLKVSPAGSVYVSGGDRLLRHDDLPPSAILSRPLPERPPAGATPPTEPEQSTAAVPPQETGAIIPKEPAFP